VFVVYVEVPHGTQGFCRTQFEYHSFSVYTMAKENTSVTMLKHLKKLQNNHGFSLKK
jgi:hypothetical protein